MVYQVSFEQAPGICIPMQTKLTVLKFVHSTTFLLIHGWTLQKELFFP